jgi:hypothetical protein
MSYFSQAQEPDHLFVNNVSEEITDLWCVRTASGLRNNIDHLAHLKDEGTDSQRGKLSCSKTQSNNWEITIDTFLLLLKLHSHPLYSFNPFIE